MNRDIPSESESGGEEGGELRGYSEDGASAERKFSFLTE
jgi:hypothetical protein